MIFRIALGLARSPAPEHKWRRVVVPVAAFIFMLLLASSVSVVSLMDREAQREAARVPLEAEDPSPNNLFVEQSEDSWGGESFYVNWIEPASGEDPILPPGVSSLPEPGQAVVSPALDRLISENSDLAARYPDHRVLGAEGLRNADELLAYVRVPEGRTISKTEYPWRVGSFGFSNSNKNPDNYLESEVPLFAVVEGVIAFLIVPGLIVLGVGVAATSGIRDRRFETLHWMGAPRRMLTALTLIETLALALPGLIVASVIWAVVSPRLERVPLVGHNVIRGDLELSPVLLSLLFLTSIAATGLITVILTFFKNRCGASGGRPGTRRARIRMLRIAPLLLVVILFITAQFTGSIIGALFTLGGMLTTVAAVPLLLPILLRRVGSVVGNGEGLLTSVAGRVIEWNPVRVSRPFAGLAALIVIALTGSGYFALMNNMGESSGFKPGPVVTVNWVDPKPQDLPNFKDSLNEGVVVPVGYSKGTMEIGTDCRQLQTYFPDGKCNPNKPLEMTPSIEGELRETLSVAGGVEGKMRLKSEDAISATGNALVLGDGPLPELESQVRTAAMTTLPAPYVVSGLLLVGSVESPLMPWIGGGIAAAVLVLGMGCFISLVDRLLDTRKQRLHLLNLGIRPRQLAFFEAFIFALPYSIVFFSSFAIGLLVCYLIVVGPISGVPMPWNPVFQIALSGGVAGIIGTASVAMFGSRSVQKTLD